MASPYAELVTVLDAMSDHLRSQRNVIMDRRDFYSRVQEPNESFDDFLCSVKEIANFCEFCENCINNELRDRIVVGTSDEVALKPMLENKKLTLESDIDVCRASENANQCSAVLRGDTTPVMNRITSHRKTWKSDNTKNGKVRETPLWERLSR